MLFVLNLLALLWAPVVVRSVMLGDQNPQMKYDYIVVGGGTAGCVLANRLSADPKSTVLVLEAGVDDRGQMVVEVPAYFHKTKMGPLDWLYYAQPQKDGVSAAFTNEQCQLNQGKMLGGSSSMNAMIWLLGNRQDYDNWESVYGADGWDWEGVHPYFMKAENNRNASFAATGFYGTTGPVTVTDRVYTEIHQTFLDASLELGYSVGDTNDGDNTNKVMHTQATIQTDAPGDTQGKRDSTASAYLHPVNSRENLHVKTQAEVIKLNYAGNSLVVKGVTYFDHTTGDYHKVEARKEVIVSCGYANSAKLLMLSGIGPQDHLKYMSIPLQVELPVGNNLMDHVALFLPEMGFFKEGLDVSFTNAMMLSDASMSEYFTQGTGPLAMPWGIESVGFFISDSQPSSDTRPYLELQEVSGLMMRGDYTQGARYDYAFSFKSGTSDVIWGDTGTDQGMAIIPTLVHSAGRGTVRLSGSNWMDEPIIDPVLLSNAEDVDTLVEGLKLATRYANTTAFAKYEPQVHRQEPDFCAQHTYESDDWYACMAKAFAKSLWHGTGTCRMGAANDPLAVVDSRLRVRGVKNLRVADASVMPEVITGHTMAPTIMIGEKAAAMILEDNSA